MQDFSDTAAGGLPLDQVVVNLASGVDRLATPEHQASARIEPSTSTHIELTFGVVSGGTGNHYIAQVELFPGVELIVFFVTRPEQRYVFLATYLVNRPPFAPGSVKCFHLRCEDPDPAVSEEQQICQLVEEEARAMLSGVRNPNSQVLGPFRSMEVCREIEVAGGVGKLVHNFWTGIMTASVDVRRSAGLNSCDRKALKRLIPEFGAVLPHARGGRPVVDKTSVRKMFDDLVPACSALLDAVKARPWPPANRASGLALAEQFLPLPQAQRRVAYRVLCRGRRRPSTPEQLARRILVQITGLSEKRIVDLTRK